MFAFVQHLLEATSGESTVEMALNKPFKHLFVFLKYNFSTK